MVAVTIIAGEWEIITSLFPLITIRRKVVTDCIGIVTHL